jgi:PHD/YefM family antitoxin component YafN of YafNO toxin-antitoxin module
MSGIFAIILKEWEMTMADSNNILKESPATYRAAAVEVKRTGKPVVVERQGGIAVAILPWETFRAFESWYEEQERERRWREQHEAFEREVAAFEQMKDELLAEYECRCVAIHDGKVVEAGDDKMKVLERVRDRFGPVTVYVQWVEKRPRVYRISGPRKAR